MKGGNRMKENKAGLIPVSKSLSELVLRPKKIYPTVDVYFVIEIKNTKTYVSCLFIIFR